MGIRSRETSSWKSPAVGGRSLGGGVGITGEKAWHGGPGGMAGAAADRQWGVVSRRVVSVSKPADLG